MVRRFKILAPWFILIWVCLLEACSGKNDNEDLNPDLLQISAVRIGSIMLKSNTMTEDISVGKPVNIEFSQQLDTATLQDRIFLKNADSVVQTFTRSYLEDYKTITLELNDTLDYLMNYRLILQQGIRGKKGELFPGVAYDFRTQNGKLEITGITINGENFNTEDRLRQISSQVSITVNFNVPVNSIDLTDNIRLFKPGQIVPLTLDLSDNNRIVTIINDDPLETLSKYYFSISTSLESGSGFSFDGFSNSFFTRLDSVYQFPVVTDDQLLTLVQSQTFKYFWDFAHPDSGLARERNTSGETVTTGGSGFGLMAILVGMERGFITHAEGIERFHKIFDFLEQADRFHGAWPHWMNGSTGEVIPFSSQDDGGDLVETSFLAQGMLTVRQYLDPGVPDEKALIGQINTLWKGIEWNWYTQGGQDVLYWHWSPDYGWAKNFPIHGYNEALITYVLAAASPDYNINASVYHNGWALNGDIVNGQEYYGITLPLGYDYGGPLFFAHYSFLGLDPRNLSDAYADYWQQNVNHSLINWSYCADNPLNYAGYSENIWGLTASDNQSGYSAHSPSNDLGVITPTAAISSIPYTPEKSIAALKNFYYFLGDRLWGPYGFYDAFNPTEGWYADSYLAIDEGPMIVMVENYRTGLLWNLFMSAPEVQNGLDELGFTY